MDLRASVLAIVVGGAPAPGINSVISSVTLEALNNGCSVVGVREGFTRIKRGLSKGYVQPLDYADVTKIYADGGSFLASSKCTLDSDQEIDNVLRVLEHLRVRYLVTIGGTVTSYCASLVSAAAKTRDMHLSVVHVPKTIFNDLPLPQGSTTFGFATAREVGAGIVSNLKQDARSMLRWYVVVVMGQKAGHLSLGIGKAAAATLTLIPEEFGRAAPVRLATLCDIIEASVIKRRAMGRSYGVAVVTEGLVDLMGRAEVAQLWGNADRGHQELGRTLAMRLNDRLGARGMTMPIVARNLGNELRSADPFATDVVLGRDLGYGAARFLLEGGNGCMLSFSAGTIKPVPLKQIVDPKTGRTQVRLVDVSGLSYEVARKYMIRLTRADLRDAAFLRRLAQAARCTVEEFVAKFGGVATF